MELLILVEYMELIKEISSTQKAALEYLVTKASLELPNDWNSTLFVKQMGDGGMGSFMIFQNRAEFNLVRKFGRQASEYQFNDVDGIPVLVTLNVDVENRLLEVDIWKANYTPVINFKIPD
jgi:hypothetical protein